MKYAKPGMDYVDLYIYHIEVIIKRAAELAEKRGVSMTEISLAWLLTKAASPIVGAMKSSHIECAENAFSTQLSADEMGYLEDAYIPHKLAGVMAQNKSTF